MSGNYLYVVLSLMENENQSDEVLLFS